MSSTRKHQEFLAEAEDIIQGLSKNLSKLQNFSTPSNSINPDIVSDLFGGIHTLKGLSSLLEFTKIATLSHSLEDLLDSLRTGRIKLTDPMINTLSEGVDFLIRLLADINDHGEERITVDRILEKISKAIAEKGTYEKISMEKFQEATSDLFNLLSEYEAHRLTENLNNGAAAYRIEVSFQAETIDEDITRLQENLARFGEVIAFLPVSGLSSAGRIAFEIIFSSKDAEIIKNVSSLFEDPINMTRILYPFNTGEQEPTMDSSGQIEPSVKSVARTVRVSIENLDSLLNNVGEIFLVNDTISQSAKNLKTEYSRNSEILNICKASGELFKRLIALRHDLIEMRMVPIGYAFDRLAHVAKKLCKDLSKDIKVKVSGGDTKLDKSIIEGLIDALMHIIRNAVDHGIEKRETRLAAGKPETGAIGLFAYNKGNKILIEIEDDGHGLDFNKIYDSSLERGLIKKEDQTGEDDLIKLIFQPGFSTNSSVNEVSGRGVGLDVVAKSIANLGGMIDVDTTKGKGTKFSITLPLTLLIARALIVSESSRSFAIPFNAISENLILKEQDIRKIRGREVFNTKGRFLPLVRLRDILKFPTETEIEGSLSEDRPSPLRGKGWGEGRSSEESRRRVCVRDDKKYVVVIGLGEKRVGIVVDEIEGQREILLKPLRGILSTVPGITGFTGVGARRILPVLDVGSILEMCQAV